MKLNKFARICLMSALLGSILIFSGCGDSSDQPAPQVAPIVVLTKMDVLAGQETAARTAIVNFVTETQKEAGVISYDVYQGNGAQDHTYWFREVWKDQAAINTHFATPQFGTLVAAAPTLFNVQFTAGGTSNYFVVTTQTTTASAKSLLTGAVGIAYYKAKTADDVAANTLLTALAQSSQAAAGNVSYDLFRYEAAYGMPVGTYQTFSQWQGSNAYDLYLASTLYTTFNTQIAGLLDTPSTTTLATMVTTPKTLSLKAEQIAEPQPLSPEIKSTLKEYAKKMSGQ